MIIKKSIIIFSTFSIIFARLPFLKHFEIRHDGNYEEFLPKDIFQSDVDLNQQDVTTIQLDTSVHESTSDDTTLNLQPTISSTQSLNQPITQQSQHIDGTDDPLRDSSRQGLGNRDEVDTTVTTSLQNQTENRGNPSTTDPENTPEPPRVKEKQITEIKTDFENYLRLKMNPFEEMCFKTRSVLMLTPFYDVYFSEMKEWANRDWKKNLFEWFNQIDIYKSSLARMTFQENETDFDFAMENLLLKYQVSTHNFRLYSTREQEQFQFLRNELTKQKLKKEKKITEAFAEVEKLMKNVEKAVNEKVFEYDLEEGMAKYRSLKNLLHGMNFKMKSDLSYYDYESDLGVLTNNLDLCTSLVQQLRKSSEKIVEFEKKKREREVYLKFGRYTGDTLNSFDEYNMRNYDRWQASLKEDRKKDESFDESVNTSIILELDELSGSSLMTLKSQVNVRRVGVASLDKFKTLPFGSILKVIKNLDEDVDEDFDTNVLFSEYVTNSTENVQTVPTIQLQMAEDDGTNEFQFSLEDEKDKKSHKTSTLSKFNINKPEKAFRVELDRPDDSQVDTTSLDTDQRNQEKLDRYKEFMGNNKSAQVVGELGTYLEMRNMMDPKHVKVVGGQMQDDPTDRDTQEDIFELRKLKILENEQSDDSENEIDWHLKDKQIFEYEQEISYLKKSNETLKELLRDEITKAVYQTREDLKKIGEYKVYLENVHKLSEIKKEIWKVSNEYLGLAWKLKDVETKMKIGVKDDQELPFYREDFIKYKMQLNDFYFYKFTKEKDVSREVRNKYLKYNKKKRHGNSPKRRKKRKKRRESDDFGQGSGYDVEYLHEINSSQMSNLDDVDETERESDTRKNLGNPSQRSRIGGPSQRSRIGGRSHRSRIGGRSHRSDLSTQTDTTRFPMPSRSEMTRINSIDEDQSSNQIPKEEAVSLTGTKKEVNQVIGDFALEEELIAQLNLQRAYKRSCKKMDNMVALTMASTEFKDSEEFNCFSKAQLLYTIFMMSRSGMISNVGAFLDQFLSSLSVRKAISFMLFSYGVFANKNFMKKISLNYNLNLKRMTDSVIDEGMRKMMMIEFKRNFNFLIQVSNEMIKFSQNSYDNHIFEDRIGEILVRNINESLLSKLLDFTNYNNFRFLDFLMHVQFSYETSSQNKTKLSKNLIAKEKHINENLAKVVSELIRDWCRISDFLLNVPFMTKSVGQMYGFVENFLRHQLTVKFHISGENMRVFSYELEKCKESYYRVYQVELNFKDYIEDRVSEKDILETGIDLLDISEDSLSVQSKDEIKKWVERELQSEDEDSLWSDQSNPHNANLDFLKEISSETASTDSSVMNLDIAQNKSENSQNAQDLDLEMSSQSSLEVIKSVEFSQDNLHTLSVSGENTSHNKHSSETTDFVDYESTSQSSHSGFLSELTDLDLVRIEPEETAVEKLIKKFHDNYIM